MTRNDATAATRAAQAAAALPPEDDAFTLADRGFIGSIDHAEVPGIWSQRPYAFVDGDAPATVHPGLWRQARLNGRHGLFEVVPGIYQVRGFDLSTVTFVRGETGWNSTRCRASPRAGAMWPRSAGPRRCSPVRATPMRRATIAGSRSW